MKKILPYSVKTNKKGNISVMLSMIFVCLMMIVVVLVNASTKVSNYSYCDCVLQLAGRSILSEYHIALKEKYGIMAFKSYNQETNEKLQFYVNSSFNRKKAQNILTLIKPRLNSINCDLSLYSLTDVDNFENDIIDYMKHPRLKQQEKGGQVYEGKGQLMNERIINALPSKELEDEGFNISSILSNGVPSWKELSSQNTKNLIVNEYILNNFNYQLGLESSTETFFRNELEYILYGKLSDSENQDNFIKDFKAMRLILNSAHLYADFEKRNQILEMAELMTPGPQAPITAIALAETWAYAESLNDVKLLLAGEKVALYKNKQNWALDLDSAIKGTNKGGYVKPASNEGYTYKDYLRIFFYFEDRELKLMRMMDLIQINIQGGFDEGFYIKDCYIGFKFYTKINGQEYCYVENY
ncbi:DUF5702 domain-containing protein [Aminipila sp.]|uniref:DUF5702 domain-containing protein n=1 Tax=Aminipila sp. TaxID=2060095 RepID=UPI00289FE7FC|nr:DUF5702 domain-containing protein [Aminipila sp.]